MLVSAIEHQYRVPYGVLWHNNGKVTDLEEKPTVTSRQCGNLCCEQQSFITNSKK